MRRRPGMKYFSGWVWLAGIIVLLADEAGRAQSAGQLRSGPLVGYVGQGSARIWVQTTAPATVWVTARDTLGQERRSSVARTVTDSVLVGQVRLDSLRPGMRYDYRVWLNGSPLGLPRALHFRTPPAGPGGGDGFTLATGSCALVKDPYEAGQGYEIFASLARQQPDLMLWLGDNVYLNEGEWADVTRRRYRYGHTRGLPQLQPLLGSTANVAIWDDHDFGPNNADRTEVVRREARETFDLFWANPPPARPEAGGLTTRLSWGDVDIFLLDNRSFRSPDQAPRRTRTQLGADQIRWLLRGLRESRATFKLVATGGQVLSTSRRGETMARHYNRERRALLDSLARYRIAGVVLLNGDRHFTELSRLRRRRAPVLYELTVSPLTSGPAKPWGWNRHRVKGTVVRERNFATLRVGGEAGKRTLTARVYSAGGE
ncbi:MAG TPA: alkaline phosphatase D family protein, partial [bacterium]|nr:alkaline phosphatase D family protein [bacterium]